MIIMYYIFIQIAFTGIYDDKLKENIEKLGGILEENIAKANYLVIKQNIRTYKMLYAMCSDIQIIHLNWIFESIKRNVFVDPV